MFFRFHRFVTSSLIAAALAAMPSAALADHRFETHRDDSRGNHRDWHRDEGPSGHLDIRIGGGSYERIPPLPPPVYQETVWVAPLYRSCTEQVLVPASYTTVVDRV